MQSNASQTPGQPSPARRGIRGVAALASGIGVFMVTLWTGFGAVQNQLRSRELQAIINLRRIREEIADYRSKNGKWPDRLEQLSVPKQDGQAVDLWLNPYQYEPRGDGFVLFSTGRDGAPGGIGPDTDIDGTEDYKDPKLDLTFRQFLSNHNSPKLQESWSPAGMLVAAGLAGALAAGLVLRPTSPWKRSATTLHVLADLVAIIVITFLVGLFLVIAHVPSGH